MSYARIAIVDDHPLVREGLRARISRQPDMEVCGEADNVHEAVALIEQTDPDVMIVDLALKTSHGLDLIRRVKSSGMQTRMLVSSMYDESIYADRVIQAGAMGYINKQEAPETLITAIRRILAGKIYLSERMTEAMLQEPGEATIGSRVASLTDRQVQVLELIGGGMRTGDIAKRLCLSVHTVDTYRQNLKSKLGLHDGAALNQFAFRWLSESERRVTPVQE